MGIPSEISPVVEEGLPQIDEMLFDQEHLMSYSSLIEPLEQQILGPACFVTLGVAMDFLNHMQKGTQYEVKVN